MLLLAAFTAARAQRQQRYSRRYSKSVAVGMVAVSATVIAAAAAASIWRHLVAGQRAISIPSSHYSAINSNLEWARASGQERYTYSLLGRTPPPAPANPPTLLAASTRFGFHRFAGPGGAAASTRHPSNSKSCYFFSDTSFLENLNCRRRRTPRKLKRSGSPESPSPSSSHHAKTLRANRTAIRCNVALVQYCWVDRSIKSI